MPKAFYELPGIAQVIKFLYVSLMACGKEEVWSTFGSCRFGDARLFALRVLIRELLIS